MAEAATPAEHAAPAGAGETAAPTMSWRVLLALVIPAIVVGVASALILMTATLAGKWIEDILWTRIPDGLGVDPSGPAWIFIVLTLAGVAIGLVVTFVPGHAGPDPATVELAAA